ncbi:MAG: bifunctional UDP-N-acetylglucosamine diphosphorylase/glucosamine-1-phosphate N-acetyltransferase GlmU [Clostridia bacterium]|nr:bifunctional UDP-N-acetylglucosamine diphosphorylase/glucosamine-1-phosphate N-acetyltransferase GlmU [Clostridia bacterium]
MNSVCSVILAGGEGTRMKSSKPKVMAQVLFKPMINWVISAAQGGGVEDICVVTGYRHEILEEHLDGKCATVFQSQRLGTGHAVMQAKDFIKEHIDGDVLILNGDAPLMDSETISNALQFHKESGNCATVISAKVANPFGYGRIQRSDDGLLQKIVEQKEATEEQKKIDEVNSGAFWFSAKALLSALDTLAENHTDASKEYYLTDAIEIILSKGGKAAAFTAKTADVVLGANDRAQLYELNEIARKQILVKHMKNGVSIPCIDGVIISPDAEIGADTQILPGTIIKGNCTIGKECEIGPNSLIENSVVHDGVELNSTQVYSSEVKAGAHIGPFVRIRPDCVVGENVRVGNFVELKNARIGEKTSVSHLSYIGDAEFGKNINVGCGCATVNFNGRDKNKTIVGDNAFIGCSTYLVAPVEVGENAFTAAGSVITEDVPKDALAIARSRQVVKEDWVNKVKPYRWQKKEETK